MSTREKSHWIRLPWDSEHFGFAIARLHGSELSPENLRTEIETAQESGIRCLYWLANENAVAALPRSPSIKVLDTRVTYSCLLRNSAYQSEPGWIGARTAQSQDLAALLRMASISHANTRFFEDDSFPVDRARSLYSVWIEKAFSDPDQMVFVSGSHEQPGAYITCGPSPESSVASIGLVAVAPDQRREGHAQRLVATALKWARERGFQHLEVATQGQNHPARRLYEKNGFDLVDESTWVHIWLEGSETAGENPTTLKPPRS
jgi:GNAT superfamily N-acetyltransferase